MRKAWKGHKYKLHTYFKDIGGEDDVNMAKRMLHPDLKKEQQQDWEILCDHWSSEKFKNTEARSERMWGSRNGSVSTPHHHIRRGEDLTSMTGQIETWRERHHDLDNGWICPDLESIYDHMIALRAEHTLEVLSDKDIMEHILERHSVYLGGDPRRPTYDELAECLTSRQQQLFEVVEGLNECRQVLREHNLMPPPRCSTTVSDQNSGLATRIPPTTQRTFEHDDDC
ncbi:hypothetical protein PanWU01x14_002920 [Parasponia andersonii]|uniref:Transposase, Ptta/En/Spm, plant n=1 Tax=Parasponia andersonii TaxID=3476 RepID=A0A2P5E5B0_PARAD|nr:hypothetical protein PanWU01x14_002920 [Parasponia andersonii]